MIKALKNIGLLLAAAVVLFGLIQLVPYGRNHTNPAVVQEPQWDSPQTRALAQRACFDCHSNETVWPWYSNVAPFSWLIQHDVDEGRQRMNLSEYGSRRLRTGEVSEVISRGSMPPAQYLILHPSARLTTEEKNLLINGFQATFSGSTLGELSADQGQN